MSSRNFNFEVNESKYLKYKNKYLAFKKKIGGASAKTTNKEIKKREDVYSLILELFILNNIVSFYPNFINNKTIIDAKEGEQQNIDFDKNNELIYLNLSFFKLKKLPDNFSYLHVLGDLVLSFNCITKLPPNFVDNIIVTGNLLLDNNNITELPDNFHHINVGGTVSIAFNKIKKLPKVPDPYINKVQNKYPTYRELLLGPIQTVGDGRYQETELICNNRSCRVDTLSGRGLPGEQDHYKKQGPC